ncbi:MAG: hypothetical protein H6555_02085 [Lewinellaceae bacterium]|nr:hypothetical protein [Lewinellaceae bacterium]
MKQLIGWLAIVFLFPWGQLAAQSYNFGIKGGLTVGTQRWDNSFQREPLFRYHGIAFIESADEGSPFALFAQGGYHIKGSAIRTYRTVLIRQDGSRIDVPGQETPFEFHNVSVTLGAKQRFDVGPGNSQLYYALGIRGDYTVKTDFGNVRVEDNPSYALIYPVEGFVNKFNYGLTVGGGIELPFSEFVGMLLEFTVNPDFSLQYNQPVIRNVINPNPIGGSSLIDIPERRIANLTFEVTLGFRFLHKIIFID